MSVTSIATDPWQAAIFRPYVKETAKSTSIADAILPPAQNPFAESINSENSAYKPAISPILQISPAAHQVLLEQQEVADDDTSSVTVSTNNSEEDIDFDDYFSNTPARVTDLSAVPILIPSLENIQAISQHATERFKQILIDNGIPAAPEKITYDGEGKMHLPDDYPYKKELTEALAQNPGLDNELRALNALSSHYVEMQKLMPFQTEIAAAQSQIEIEAIIDKYSYLLNGNRQNSSMALTFSGDSEIGISANGEAVKLS